MRSSDDSSTAGSFAAARTRRERLRHLTPGDLWMGLQAPVCLPLAAVALRRWGLQRVQGQLARWTGRAASTSAVTAASVDDARRLAWVVSLAARFGPWPANCLQRSLVLWWFLARRGVPSEIRIGVRRRPGSPSGRASLDFHAWVESHGEVINDRRGIRRRFATFDRGIAPTDVRWR